MESEYVWVYLLVYLAVLFFQKKIKIYENVIFSGFSTLNFVLSTMAGMALREDDIGYERFLLGKVQAAGILQIYAVGCIHISGGFIHGEWSLFYFALYNGKSLS